LVVLFPPIQFLPSLYRGFDFGRLVFNPVDDDGRRAILTTY
jgi:hypothetical protein